MSLPTRTRDDDVTTGEDTSEVTTLFENRLTAWKHACDYLEDYVSKTEKMQHAHAKEYEKVMKTVNSPLKEGDQFSQNIGGIAELFDSMKTNTQVISNSHAETAKVLKDTVLPIFTRLDSELKHKQKELKKGVGKGSKTVDKARNTTQKHIELLGKHTAAFDSIMPSKPDASTDPYVLRKGVNHRLHNQILEENSTRQDMLGVQQSFSQFEAHIVQVIQQGLGAFYNAVGHQCDEQKRLYGNIAMASENQNPSFEWNAFIKRNNQVLIDPTAPQRTLENVSYPNQNHSATQALCQGALERKQGLLKKYDSSFYAITPAKFMHEFKDDDDLKKDPSPELSLYLPDCTVGGLNDNVFSVKGKDTTSKLSLSGTKEYEFRARTPDDAETWWRVVRAAVSDEKGAASVSPPADDTPVGLRRDQRVSTIGSVRSTSGSMTGTPTSPTGTPASPTGTPTSPTRTPASPTSRAARRSGASWGIA